MIKQANQAQVATPAEQIFEAKFTDAAFSTFRSKYPQLASIVVTFKVIESDIDTGTGLGTFILRTAKDVAYVPVVMSSGAIASCEMLYDKASNGFMPLLPKVVQDVVNTNRIETASLLAKPPKVEDTRNLFRNMIRPPHSSNAILASSGADSAVAALPNAAKSQVVSYLEGHPKLLAKIAEFYPVEVLAEKLAKTAEEPLPKVDYPDVVSIDALKEDTLKSLSPEDKESLLRDGYAVRSSADKASVSVLPFATFTKSFEKEYDISEVSAVDGKSEAKVGHVFSLNSGALKLKKALILNPSAVILDDAHGEVFRDYRGDVPCSSTNHRAPYVDTLIASQVHQATLGDLIGFGATPASRISDTKKNSVLIVLYPTKSGAFKVYTRYAYDGIEVNKSDNAVTFNLKNNSLCCFTKDLTYGSLDVHASESGTVLFPYNSLVVVSAQTEKFPIVKSLDKVMKYIHVMGTSLRVVDDGAQILVNDARQKGTKALSKKAEAAKYLVDTYGMGADGVAAALNSKHVFLLSKTAFLTRPAIQEQPSYQQEQASTFMQPSQGFAPEVIEDFAGMGDQDLMDTGILASFAKDSDIKENFVDLLPSFSEALTSVGRTILICSMQRKEMEDYYGREKYQTFVTNCKRVFKTLGEVVVGLKEYINMNQ